ncbi:hypothetical protein C4D60_Mb05t20890 [Musa balbisiana]|uniref:Uncharacterized protein n=1 Tax=Musa balbisiana TaxID=52838 RepID=A0A4S8JXP7_MUSBA|nr:hypothetical protein C4D60_Mb05t20890 [Musa balbisiana]
MNHVKLHQTSVFSLRISPVAFRYPQEDGTLEMNLNVEDLTAETLHEQVSPEGRAGIAATTVLAGIPRIGSALPEPLPFCLGCSTFWRSLRFASPAFTLPPEDNTPGANEGGGPRERGGGEERKEKKKVSGRCEEEEGKGKRRGVPVRSMSAGDLRQASLEKSKERERDGGMTDLHKWEVKATIEQGCGMKEKKEECKGVLNEKRGSDGGSGSVRRQRQREQECKEAAIAGV